MSADISNFVATKRDMIERLVVIDSVDPVIFYGVNNSNMQLIRSLFPKLRVAARGTLIKVLGDEQETAEFEKKIKELEDYCSKYNQLGEEVILDVVKGKPPKELKMDDVIIYGVNGKPIQGRSANQQKLVKAFQENDLTFALGPAGTGKTYIAVAMAINAFKNKEVQKIILARPAVEAGERLGFLPGDLQEKVDTYLRPLYDALYDVLGRDAAQRLKEKEAIEVVPLAYMRGRTLDNSFIILDEAQNTTREQMKMFLTRMGFGSKVVVTGDITQIDLPRGKKSGLVEAQRVLKDVKDIDFCYLKDADVVRHELVRKIIGAYDRYYKKYPEELTE